MASGDQQQQFCLRWNDFQSNIVTCFKHLRTERSFTDVTLACDGQTCKAHKMVLSACSPYFKSLLEVVLSIRSFHTKCHILQILQLTVNSFFNLCTEQSFEASNYHTQGRTLRPLAVDPWVHVRRRGERSSGRPASIPEDRWKTQGQGTHWRYSI